MDNRLDFNFNLPRPPAGDELTVSHEQLEQVLLQRVAAAKGNPSAEIWELAQFYKGVGRLDKAFTLLRDLLERTSELEMKAAIIFSLGQTAEKSEDFDLAARFYREALSLEPCNPMHWYFIHNNLGYSLNQIGRFDEAAEFCRRAIEIDPKACNAYKNLGVALQGLERYPEAAEAFVKATQANASDPRSVELLEKLMAEQAELEFEFGDFLRACREAVRIAKVEVEKIQAKWKKPSQ